MKIITDLKDRFTTWKTLRGAFVMAGAVFVYFYPEYIINIAIPAFMFLQGAKDFFTNDYRAQAKEWTKVEQYQRLHVGILPLLLVVFMLIPSQQPDLRCKPCEPSEVGVRLIQRWEGYVPVLYRDAAGLWTIGFGHLVAQHEIEKYRGRALTADEGDALFRMDLIKHADDVNRLVKIRLWQWQFDAAASFVFNVGGGNFRRSTLLRKINAGQHAEVPTEFQRWVYAGGKKLRGLALRRDAEARLYALVD